ncbi:hypothetical protein PFDG_00263 [Plasmodium falciparum Dd2]|uniref:Rifin n=1 Tax=Plasmodium falciparum (isolate Dd2) TaxID=57267 RepID=A0A0L7M5U4_PLAF4|nr:hypothetical protein PFDG_00263 [Plasmodium falciparum Dd2]
MKLHYTKILLFFFPLYILVYSKNKPSITSHHTQTNRSLCECDTQSTNYNNDDDMKSVKENFNRQTSQRFEEYEERMKRNRQKYKEQCEKDIQKIILKDKMERSFAEKIERGCLKCGCGLGGVAASIGIFGTVAVKELTKASTVAAIAAAQEAAAAKGAVAGAEAGIKTVISGLQKLGVSTLGHKELGSYITSENYIDVSVIFRAINNQYEPSSCLITVPVDFKPICTWVMEKSAAAMNIPGNVSKQGVSTNALIQEAVETIVSDAKTVAQAASREAAEEVIKSSTAVVEAKYAIFQNAIIASVVALLIIVLVMIIIYLVLRYRRKNKMDKKTQYTKLLNQ